MSRDESEQQVSRRAVLSGSAAGAAAVAAGGLVVAGASTAGAVSGEPLLAGRTNTASSATTLITSANVRGLSVTSKSTGTLAHAIVGSSVNGYGLRASSTGHNGAWAATTSPDHHGLLAENGARDDAGAGAAIHAIHRFKGVDGATAVRGVQGPVPDQLIESARFRTIGRAAAGEFAGACGVIGAAGGEGYGVIGYSQAGYGVWAGGSGYYVFFADGHSWVNGNLMVAGELTHFGATAKIDHPLDPENRYLAHSFVESPDMKNVYDGVIELDGDGAATVEMPEWFEALNRDFRYQLTALGAPAPQLHVSAELLDGRFSIAGGAPGQRVSWQVTGIRQDAWAEANRVQVESDKPRHERGTYLYPQGFAEE